VIDKLCGDIKASVVPQGKLNQVIKKAPNVCAPLTNTTPYSFRFII
jgi:hypothetical protein